AMQQLTGAKIISCNNIRKKTMPFYTFLGYYPDKLNHYYRLRDLDEYKIAWVTDKNILPCHKAKGVWLKQFFDIEEVKADFHIPQGLKPQKDYWYIEKRYFKYPHYKYNLFGVYNGEDCLSLVVFRVNEGCEGNVLRLVDFIGAPANFCLLNGFIDDLILQYDCEYCDMYSFGVDGVCAGFTQRIGEEVIIPNYLDPLWKKNIDYFFFTSDKDGFTMFKADGDQDRKNLG
ncbi:MAG: hypothetical protein RR253_06615, partial [Oscillospiraceae bacterium]